MTSHHSRLSRCAAACIIGAAAPLPVSARPGALVAGQGSVIERPGDVLAASPGEDGSVMLAGLFSRVGTAPAPGVARLKESGVRDSSFVSGVGIGAPATVPPPGSAAAVTVPCPVFQNLPGGQMMIGDPPGGRQGWQANVPLWFVMGGAGDVIVNPLPVIDPDEPVMPQFVEDGKLVAIVSSSNAQGLWQSKVRRLRLDTGADDPDFSARLTGTPSQVLPAGSGALWVLERDAQGQRVLQLKSTGEVSPAIPAVAVSSSGISLQTMPAGALAVSSSQWEWQEANAAWGWTHRLQRFAGDGTPASPRIQEGGVAPFYIEPDGALLVEFSPPVDVNPIAATARRRVLSRELPNGQADAGFSAITARRFLHRLADGRLLADGTRRSLPDGTPDPAWSVPAVMNHGTVRALYAAPGGMVVGCGDFTLVDGQPRPGVARWRADGALDSGFVPSAAEGEVQDCAVATDGSLTILRGGSLQRLRADGGSDAGFVPTTSDLRFFDLHAWEEIESLPGGELLALTAGTVARISRQGQCTLLRQSAGLIVPRGLRALPDGRFFHAGRRWLSDGSPDASFAPSGMIGSVPLCAAGADQWLFYRGSSQNPATLPVVLLGDDGRMVPSGLTQAIPTGTTAAAGDAGNVMYTAEGNTVIRRLADGRRDVSFRAPRLERRNESVPEGMPLLSAVRNGGEGSVSALLVHPLTGQLWLAGDFTSAGGTVRSGLAVLDTSTPGGYTAWSAAVFENASAAPAADPDHDGLSNFQEYAAGTDPLTADAAAGGVVILTLQPLTVSAPQNPAAPEVFQTLEFSADLASWRTATGAEAVLRTVNGAPAFELAPAAGPRFVRVRYQSAP